MEGLVQADKCEGIVYNDPIVAAQEVTDLLRTKEGCDVVICLSHLGFRLKMKSAMRSWRRQPGELM